MAPQRKPKHSCQVARSIRQHTSTQQGQTLRHYSIESRNRMYISCLGYVIAKPDVLKRANRPTSTLHVAARCPRFKDSKKLSAALQHLLTPQPTRIHCCELFMGSATLQLGRKPAELEASTECHNTVTILHHTLRAEASPGLLEPTGGMHLRGMGKASQHPSCNRSTPGNKTF